MKSVLPGWRYISVLIVTVPLATCAGPVSGPRSGSYPIPEEITHVPIGRDHAVNIAMGAFRRQVGSDPWLRRERLTALLVRAGDRRVWGISWSASPIAGGGGSAQIDADTGEVLRVFVPKGQR